MDINLLVSKSFKDPFKDQHRYLVLCGGRGSGKSEFAARKIFYRCQVEGDHRFLILRKVRKTCGVSVIKVFQCLLSENAIAYNYNKSDHVIAWQAPNGTVNELLFDGLDEPEKIKSIKGLTGIWIEEATEFSEKEFNEVDLVLREPTPNYKQIILSFNPDEALAPWLKKRFFDNIDPNSCVHVSTIEDNPIASMREEYRKQLSLLTDETRKKIYLYGMWAALRGSVYDWDVVSAPGVTSSGERVRPDEHFYGGDFGYSVNPAAVIKVYRKADEFWVEEILYETGLTNQDIGAKLKVAEGFDIQLPTYWDSAEQKSIEELYRFGINAYPADKGPGSVKTGIDFLKSKKIHIVAGSTNIIREAGRYKWREDKNGDAMPEPEKFDDHALDAIRYAIYTHCKQEVFFGFAKERMY